MGEKEKKKESGKLWIVSKIGGIQPLMKISFKSGIKMGFDSFEPKLFELRINQRDGRKKKKKLEPVFPTELR